MTGKIVICWKKAERQERNDESCEHKRNR